jgi:predicted small secreted protein
VTHRAAAGLALASAALILGSCRNTADGAREDARRAAREAEKAAQDAKKEIDRAAREAESAVKEAGRDARRASRESTADLNAAKQTIDVRAALAVSKEISSGSTITVQSDEAGRTIILVGTAAAAAERSAAERIARKSADGLRIDNRLAVAPAR